jgi:tRNA pseudouridine55 synthase
MSAVSEAHVAAAARSFVGDIEQMPPMVSAVRVGGRRLHELARKGEEVEREARAVTVHRLEVAPIEGESGVYRLDVECSSGTYIRSLAADIGAALGGGAHLRNLRRTAIGSFTLDEATSIEQVAVRPPAEALRDYASVAVSDEVAAAVGHGKVLPLDVLGATGEGPWAVLGPTGDLLAVYEPHERGAKPAVVLAPAG